jgi:hypothetical protein
MVIVKVSNYIKENGQCDYKGLDLSKIVAGSQLYPNQTECYFYYDGDPVDHTDITVIDEATYNNVKNTLHNATLPSLEERVSALEEALLQALGIY